MTVNYSPFTHMADGTIKQINPLLGTEVWTVPGRGNRPLDQPQAMTDNHSCAFCWDRKRETPPEKARMLSDATVLRHVPAAELDATDPDFRRIPNLFEIVTFDYWHANYGMEADAELIDAYLAEDSGYDHVKSVVEAKLRRQLDGEDLKLAARAFFSGSHDVIVARRHHGGSGSLSKDEHARFIAFTIDAMRDLYEKNPYAKYVAAFQNWLKPAGASFDHLHKQLVAIDEHGPELRSVERVPNVFEERGIELARKHDLIIAENEHAVLFAGIGHPYPTLEVYSKAPGRPWEHSAAEVRGFSDVLHAAHRAIGAGVPCNEEWHHQPRDVHSPMPWRVNLKLRTSTLAGFEGSTHIYLNTISPWDLKEKVLEGLDNHR
ncbi:DUF4921 family protein [Corynebacterium ammoniagenes]|uniref:DUF4921 family protein n=1 Tax=Corynebacterium ammoniagenes TaxID=1697 RepID=UPI0030B909BE